MIIVNCKVCGKKIKTYPSWIKAGKSQYCSVEHASLERTKKLMDSGIKTRFKKGQKTWNKIGFQFTRARKDGKYYKLIHAPEHPFSTSKGYVREHRLVMEAKLGRYLQKDEIVHHIDGNTLNNDINNFELTNVSEHTTFHLKLRHAQKRISHPCP